MTSPDPTPLSPEPLTAVDDQLAELASALCMDAQVLGYDHGKWPTLVSFQPPYCPRHLGVAVNVRASLMERSDDLAARSPADPSPEPLREALREVAENNHREGFHDEDGGPASFQECADPYCQKAASALAAPTAGAGGLAEAIKADLTALAHWSPEDWQERGRGADSIARTINAARDIVDRHLGGSDGR